MRIGTKTHLKTDSFAVFESPILWTQSDKFQAELRLLYQSAYQSIVPPLTTREYHPKVLERLDLQQCIVAYLQHRLSWVSGEAHYLGLCRANFHSGLVARSRRRLSACWRPCSEDASSTKPPAKSKRLIVQLPTVTPLLTRLWLFVQFIQFIYGLMKRSGESIHLCRRPIPTVKGCDLTPSTRT